MSMKEPFFTAGKKLSGRYPNTRQEGARKALFILSMINLLNFIDRYIPSAVKELIKEDLNLSDVETAYPATGTAICIMFTATLFG